MLYWFFLPDKQNKAQMNSSHSATDLPTVLVVDDDRQLADMYQFQLSERYAVRTAYSGSQAIELLDETIDVMLLDRRMPRVTGARVLQQVRESEYDCRVIMITAVDPSFEIIELPFDDYLCKPVSKTTLIETVDQQLRVAEYDQTVRELFRKLSKLTLLEAEHSAAVLERSAEYQQLKRETRTTRTKAASLIGEFDEFESAFNSIDRSTMWDRQRVES